MKSIAIVASEKCVKEKRSNKKSWFHIRKFLNKYLKYLTKGNFVIFTNKWAKEIIKGHAPNVKVISKGENDFQSIVFIASEVARKNIETVLVFQNSKDLKVGAIDKYALLRNCDLAGANLFVNWSIKLWANYYLKNKPKIDKTNKTEKIALISHDNEKPRMAKFAFRFRNVLKIFNNNIIATSGTQKYILNHLNKMVSLLKSVNIGTTGQIDRAAHGPSGGDVAIANEIYERYQWNKKNKKKKKPFYHVIFFMDHKNMQPHMADIQVLLKACLDPRNKVNLITNSKTAEKWAQMYVDESIAMKE